MLAFSFLFLFASSKFRPATRERTFSLYPGTIPTADRGTFHLEREHFNICSSASCRRPFPYQLFLPPKSNGPRSFWLSTEFLLGYLQLSYYYSHHKEKLRLKIIKTSKLKTINIFVNAFIIYII